METWREGVLVETKRGDSAYAERSEVSYQNGKKHTGTSACCAPTAPSSPRGSRQSLLRRVYDAIEAPLDS